MPAPSFRPSVRSAVLPFGLFLVATGAHPNIPQIPGAELAITSNEAFDLPAQCTVANFGGFKAPVRPAPMASVTACTTSTSKRARFSMLPPYASVRRLLPVLRNWSIK